jgi:hypothetical protein
MIRIASALVVPSRRSSTSAVLVVGGREPSLRIGW